MGTRRVIDKAKVFEKIGYNPHPKQVLYHNSNARFKVPVCGRRFGKSTMAAHDLIPELFIPNKLFWIVGPTYDLGEKEFRPVWDRLIVGQGFGRDKRVKKAYAKKQGNMWIEFPWGTRVEVRSADHPENLVGEGLDGVIMSEAAKHREATWDRYIRASLADRRGWASFPTTPEGMNWLHEIWQYGQDPDIDEYESWRFPSWSNPHVYPGGRNDPEILQIEKTSTTEWFAQEIAGEFTAFVGKIYSEFDESTHVKRVEFNPAWPNYMAFDWGFTNPLAAVEFQVDPWDNIHIWRVHYQSFTMLEEHLQIMARREQPDGYRVDLCFGDAADPEAAMVVSTKGPAACMAEPKAKDNWRQGIDLVKRFLKDYEVGTDEYGAPLYKPKLFIDHSCKDLIREFNNYRVPQTRARGDKNEREAAHPYDDHALDALRYGLVHLFELGVRSGISDLVVSTSSSAPRDPVGVGQASGPVDTGRFSMSMEF